MNTRLVPDFIIVGAPKCGTTAWYRYLAAEPSVYMPQAKEIHYFARELFAPDYRFADRPTYEAQFSGARATDLVGQAGVYHLYSEHSAGRILEANPETRVIIMLRDPVELVHSLHAQLVFTGREPVHNFAEAMSTEFHRQIDDSRRPTEVVRGELLYRRVAKLDRQVKRFIDIFPREQLHFVVYDDIRSNTSAAYAATRSFLGLKGDGPAELLPQNVSKSVRSTFVRDQLLRNQSSVVRRVSHLLPDQLRWATRSWIQARNARDSARDPIPDELRAQLARDFEPVVRSLSLLIGRDLGSWSAP